MRPWTNTLAIAILVTTVDLIEQMDANPTTRQPKKPEHKQFTSHEETPEEIYNRLMGIKQGDDKEHMEHIKEDAKKGQKELRHKDDEYTYEYETVEDDHNDAKQTHRDHSHQTEHRKKDHSGASENARRKPTQYTMKSEIFDTLQKRERKGRRTSRERELAKRNLLRVKSSTIRRQSDESEEYVNAESFEKIKEREKAHADKKAKERATPKKDYTYEYETVEKGKVNEDDYARLGQPRGGARGGTGSGQDDDDEYTYEYQTVENKTKVAEMTSRELFKKQLAEYHQEQEERHRRRNPDEYIDKVKVEGINIKDIKDDTNETLLNYDEHGNFKWRPEWTHLRWTSPTSTLPTTMTTSTTTTRRPYLASSGSNELIGPQSGEELPEYHDSQDRSYSNIYDERLQAKLKKMQGKKKSVTRNKEVNELLDLIDKIKMDTPPTAYITAHMTTEKLDLIMDNFERHMNAMTTKGIGPIMENFKQHMQALHNSTTLAGRSSKSRAGGKRKTTMPQSALLSTRSLAERAERRERKVEYKRKLMEMKFKREKHKNLFLEMRGFAKYTEPPFTEPPDALIQEDSFDREYFYLKSERAFRRWLKYNKFRFPQLNINKRDDYEVLLRCWDTDIKKARQGIPIVTLYPPPSTFEPSAETTIDYEYVGVPVAPKKVTRKFKDSLEEAFYRRYDLLKKNHTFDSLERIIQKKEGPKYRSPQLDISEFNRKFWNVLLKEEQRDFEHLAAQKKRLSRQHDLKKQHRESIEAIASIYEKQRWIRLQIKKQLETKSTTIDRRVELDSEGREWFKGVRGITGDLPDEFYLDDKTDLPKHLRWRVDLPERVKKRKVEREKRREKELLEQGAISTTSDPLDIYKRLFIPLEMPEWQDGLPTTTTPTTTTQVTTETEHWFWIKYSKYFTEDSREELKRAYEGVPKKYLTQWMSQYFPNQTDFYRIPDDYDPPDWQTKREEYIQQRRKRIKTTTLFDISSDEEWITPYGSDEPFTYPTMTITWDWVGPNQTRYFGLLAKSKDKVKDRVVLDSSYIDQMWDKTDSKLERFDLPLFQCLRCNQSFMESVELKEHHKEHLRQEQILHHQRLMNNSVTKKKKSVPPNKSYLFYYYSNPENVDSDPGAGPFKPDYDSREHAEKDYDEDDDDEEDEDDEEE